MTTQIINAGTARYISEILSDLPHNCIFNKVLTGSGGTTVALTNDQDYIICVPFRALIDSKTAQHAHVLGVKGGVKDEEIKAYLSSMGTKKIMVTYDSLERLMTFINPQDYRLLVDESHKLIDSGSFRGTAIRGIINNFDKFKSYTFMTATPVKDKYQHPALSSLPKITINWQNITPVSVKYMMIENEFTTKISSMIVDYVRGTLKGNPYFFINSVKSICEIIKKLDKAGVINPDMVKIVVANSEENKAKIQKALGKKYSIEHVNSPNKKITFLTATAFEGCDIYDEDGVTYILTDGTKDHTKIDILTLMPQIIGRIRNSRVKDSVNIFYSPSPYFSYITEDEFEVYVKDQLAEAKGYVDTYNSTSLVTVKKALYDAAKTNAFVNEENDILEVNNEAWYSEMHNFEALHTTYYVRRVNKVLQPRTDSFNAEINGIPYMYQPASLEVDVTLADKMKLDKGISFREIAKQYAEAKDANVESSIIMEVETDQDYMLIKNFYNMYGSDKMKALKYRKTDMEQFMIAEDKTRQQDVKIAMLLNLRVGEWISKADLKDKIQAIYTRLGIDKIAKATDVEKFFGVSNKPRKIDGSVVNGFSVIAVKIKFNN